MAVNSYNQVQFNQYVPRSFQEMLTPVLHVTQQEEALQNQYLESQDKINSAMAMLNPELDKTAYSRLSKFKEDVTAAAEDLASKGFVDSGRKSNLLNLKKTYDTDFTNILNQATQRLQAASIQEQKALQDPTYRYNSARNVSLDEATNNPNIWAELAIKNGVSGAALQQQIAQQVSALKAEISENNPSLTKLKTVDGKDLLGQYMMSITQGASPQEVATAIANLTGNIKEATGIVSKMMGIVNNVMAANNVENIFGSTSKEYRDLLGYASQGLYNAVGGTSKQIVKDERDVLEFQNKLELARAEFNYNLDLKKAVALEAIKNGTANRDPFVPLLNNVSADIGVEADPERRKVTTQIEELNNLAKELVTPKTKKAFISRLEDLRFGEFYLRLEDFYGDEKTVQNSKLREFKISTTYPNGREKSNQELATEVLSKVSELEAKNKKLLIANRSFVINDPKGLDYALPGLIASGKVHDEKNKKISIDLSNPKQKSTLSDLTSGVIRITPSLLAENKLEITGVSGKKVYIDISDKKDIVTSFNRAHAQAVSLVNDLDALGLTPEDLVNAQLERDASGEIKFKDNSVVLTPAQKVAYKTYVNTINEQNMALNEITMGLLTDKK